MRNIFCLSLLFLSSLVFSQIDAADVPAPFSGTWRGVQAEESGIFVEFSPEGYYHLRVGEHRLTDGIENWGKVKYDWGKEQDHFVITIFGEREPASSTQLEAVMTDDGFLRLRIFSEQGAAVSSILLKRV